MADENMLNAGANQGQKKDTVKYEVTVTCWWNERFYREGDTVELPLDVKLPEDKGKKYFKKL
jgi:hypothetical protein